MSSGLTHIGAIARGLGYAPTPSARATVLPEAPAEARFQVSAVKPVAPAPNPAEAREQIREQVMAERGVDLFTLYKMGSQERIRAEAAILAETAMRAGQARARETATFIDLRV
jgi:hypothetical protein